MYRILTMLMTLHRQIDPSRNSKAYSKRMMAIPKTGLAPAGKRIGF